MPACKFILAESSNPAKQMAVCCAYDKAIGGNQRAPHVVINALIAGTTSSVSPLTNQMGATPGIAVGTVGDQSPSPPLMPMMPSNTRTRLKPKLIRSNKEIDMLETFLGWYAAVQKRNAVTAILDFTITDKEWKSLKALEEADAAEMSQAAVANDIDNNSGALGTENKTMGGTIDEGMV
jgi:hypothetical protein